MFGLSRIGIKLLKLRPILSVNMSKMQPAGNALTDLKDFGYQFNDQGQLRKFDKITNTITNETFQFEVSSNSDTNQKNYEALGEIITKCVYQLLIDFGLHKIYLPSDVAENEANFVFCTKPNLTDVRQLIVIIHGSGVVRAGQWSRSLIINQSIDHGTQIPYIKKAIELGYDVLITNTNNNFFLNQNGQHVKIVGNESPVEHGSLVWKQLILPANGIKSVAIVAHSYGGVVTLSLMRKFPEFFKEKCFAICFTDSVHSIGSLPSDLVQLAKKIGRNWVTSSKKLDTPLDSSTNDIPRYSAGHTKHEWTSWACIDALFSFIQTKATEFIHNKEINSEL